MVRRAKYFPAFLLLLACLLPLTGCVPIALRPWYTDVNLEFDPTFLGIQKEEDGSTMEWIKKEEYLYRIVQTNREGKKILYNARIFRIQGFRFLDLSPVPLEELGAGSQTFPLIQGHGVLRIRKSWKQGKDWSIPMDLGWLEKHLTRNPHAVRHEFLLEKNAEGEESTTLILTDSTANLQRFLIQCTRIPEAFPKPK
jgi:hypothetical protein